MLEPSRKLQGGMKRSGFNVEDLPRLYAARREEISRRVREFRNFMNRSDEEFFAELCFCLCTPQSKAVLCWNAVSRLMENRLLYTGSPEEITPYLRGVRFKERKAAYIVEARRFFRGEDGLKIKDRVLAFNDPSKMRDWLVKEVKGLGMKEASHFLRNIGLGLNLAVLDRHILKNLKRLGVIDDLPKTLTKRLYERIERDMQVFSERIGIPMAELDLLLWSLETGFVFK